jgi:hypothetical protein
MTLRFTRSITSASSDMAVITGTITKIAHRVVNRERPWTQSLADHSDRYSHDCAQPSGASG